MKVKIEFTLDVDEEAWSVAYGLERSSEIRADVKEHVEQMAIVSLSDQGFLTR